MSQTKLITKVKLPGGREIEVHELLAFMYGLPKSDMEILHIIQEKGSITADEIAGILKTTKPSVSKSLTNLVKRGLLEREKVRDAARRGRPTYVYKIAREKFAEKVNTDISKVMEEVTETIKTFSTRN